jgi:microcystin degradation protein MlrC
MKIAVAQLYYEGNDFNLTITDLEDFVCHEGAEVLSEGLLAGEIGGFVSAIRDQAVISDQLEILPTLAASALSGGRVSRVAFEDLCKRLITPMAEAGDVDAVLLSLHGATIVEGIDDAEGLLLVRLRQLLGRHLPIVVTLDLHANVTEKMVAHADILVGYQTCPHEDAFDTGFKAAQYLLAMLKTGKKPQLSWQNLPMITPGGASPCYPLRCFRCSRGWIFLISASVFWCTPGRKRLSMAYITKLLLRSRSGHLGKNCWSKKSL